MIGNVVRFFPERGFGFIHVENENHDYFFHVANVPLEADQDALQTGDRVEFDAGERKGRPMAINVCILEE